MKTLALAIVALLAASAASATINGAWSFKTEKFDGGCVMTGALVVAPESKNGVHQCQIKAHEVCPHITGDAVESCTLDEKSGVVTITSTITVPPKNAAYDPDNFHLKIEDEGRMRGRLESGGGGAPVVFYRGPAAVS